MASNSSKYGEEVCTYEEEILKKFSKSDEQEEERPFWRRGRGRVKHDSFSSVDSSSSVESPISESPKSAMRSTRVLEGKKRGRKPSHIDLEAKLERSRQSARECRARKKLRYKYLEDTVTKKEGEVSKLHQELDMYLRWCKAIDQGIYPKELVKFLKCEKHKSG